MTGIRPSIRPKRRYRSNSVKDFSYGSEIEMHTTMKQIAI